MLLPVLLEVLSLEDVAAEDDEAEDEADDFDEVACSVALLRVEFVVEFVVTLVPDMVMFAMLPVPIVEFVLEPVVVELPEEPAAPVELLLELDPGATTGVTTPLFELEAVEEGEEAVAEPVADVEVEVEASAATATASVGQVEHPPKS